MNQADFDRFILGNMPHFIAVNYQRLLEARTPQEEIERILHVYSLGLRALTIGLVSQYLIRDGDRVSDPYLNNLLIEKFPHLTIDSWQQLCFATLRAYEGHRELFFIPELYDFYWDTSTLPHLRRREVMQPFTRLTQISGDIESKRQHLQPKDEAEWKRLASESRKLLLQIFEGMAFMGKYELIRVLTHDKYSYHYELHRGMQIQTGSQAIPAHITLNQKWFYLRDETQELLPLYPFLIFWQDTKKSGVILSDTGVYEKSTYERLLYLLANLKEVVPDQESTRAYIALHSTIEERSLSPKTTDGLNWWLLQDLCKSITERRMATVSHKYRGELYLQREKTRQTFEDFLVSDKRCFVLVGRSGVGKSSFLLALWEILQQTRIDDICMLMYDGAHLAVRPSVTAAISQDFADRLIVKGRKFEEIWKELANIEGIDKKQILFCVDAINENPEAKELLQQIDELTQTHWPWLKIMFSCRPETWHVIKQGVKLAEGHYYREEHSAENLGVMLEPFSYSEKIEPFSREELPLAYAKYQMEFKLKTEYWALPVELRDMLSDPLSLWLVANSYEGKAIPTNLKVTELIVQYIDNLLESGRLHENDVRLLEQRLVPLMVYDGHYENAITSADIDAVGGGLYESIYSEQILSDGKQANYSFVNLLNADILIREGKGRYQKIGFKYERFYEYFVGRRLFELGQATIDKVDFFLSLVEATVNTVFMWGAVKNALINETVVIDNSVICKFCYTEHQRVKEMAVDVLAELGKDRRDKVATILANLIPIEQQIGRIGSIRQLVSGFSVPDNLSSRNAKKIAIEVASRLAMVDILALAAVQADPSIRTTAVRYACYMWQYNPEAVFVVLEKLAGAAVPGLIPNFAAFESVLGLSLAIFFDHTQDKDVLKRLQTVWRVIIDRLFGVNQSSGWWKWPNTFIRERVFSLAIAVIFRLLREFRIPDAPGESFIEDFFRFENEKKTLYKNFTRYFDAQGNYSKEEMERDFLAALKLNNWLVWAVVYSALVAQAHNAPIDFLPFLRKLFKEAQQDPTPNAYLMAIPNVLSNVLDYKPMLDEVFEFFVYATEGWQEYYSSKEQLPGYVAPDSSYAHFMLCYVLHHYRRTGNIGIEWVKTRTDQALKQGNTEFFRFLLDEELTSLGVNLQHPKIALDVLSVFFDEANPDIVRLSQSFLARLRTRYPNEVDDFLEFHEVPEQFRLQVRTLEPTETVGELIGFRFWFFIRDDVILSSPPLRAKMMEMFAKAADCKNGKQWMDYMLRELINLIYGDEIMKVRG